MPQSSSSSASSDGRQLALAGAVVQRAAGGEAEGAGLDGLAGQLGHRRDVLRRRRLAVGAALAHHVQAHRPVRDLGAEVDVTRLAVDVVEVLGERLPLPRQALVQGDAGDVLDTLHQLDEAVVVGRADRGEPDAAVAHHGRGDAVPARRGELGVPRRLAVVVGVDVDVAGRHEGAVGVDLAATAAIDLADGGDHPVVDGHISGAARLPGPIDDATGTNDEIVNSHGDDHLQRTRVAGPPVAPWSGAHLRPSECWRSSECGRTGISPSDTPMADDHLDARCGVLGRLVLPDPEDQPAVGAECSVDAPVCAALAASFGTQ